MGHQACKNKHAYKTSYFPLKIVHIYPRGKKGNTSNDMDGMSTSNGKKIIIGTEEGQRQ